VAPGFRWRASGLRRATLERDAIVGMLQESDAESNKKEEAGATRRRPPVSDVTTG